MFRTVSWLSCNGSEEVGTPTTGSTEEVRFASLNEASLGDFMVQENILFDQRKYPRFKPKTQILILHSQLGVVNDISVNGLSYDYYCSSKEESVSESCHATIFVADGPSLKDIPLVVVDEMSTWSEDSDAMRVKQCRLCFPELMGQQLRDLEAFILNYSTLLGNNLSVD